jgi:hypothetical protein
VEGAWLIFCDMKRVELVKITRGKIIKISLGVFGHGLDITRKKHDW